MTGLETSMCGLRAADLEQDDRRAGGRQGDLDTLEDDRAPGSGDRQRGIHLLLVREGATPHPPTRLRRGSIARVRPAAYFVYGGHGRAGRELGRPSSDRSDGQSVRRVWRRHALDFSRQGCVAFDTLRSLSKLISKQVRCFVYRLFFFSFFLQRSPSSRLNSSHFVACVLPRSLPP